MGHENTCGMKYPWNMGEKKKLFFASCPLTHFFNGGILVEIGMLWIILS